MHKKVLLKAGFHKRRSRSRNQKRIERYVLVKIKPTESEAEHWFCLWLRRLWSIENCIVGVASRSGRINQWQYSIPGLAISRFSRFCFRLWQPSFHRIISEGVVNGIRRNGNVLILPTPIRRAYDSAHDSDFRFSLGHNLFYYSDYDSDSLMKTSLKEHKCFNRLKYHLNMFAICISTGSGPRLHSSQHQTWNSELATVYIFQK